MKIALSIAGFDGSGGAGLQADLKTFSALGCYGTTVVTALAIQNTQEVRDCFAIPADVVDAQLETLFDDIRPHVIKIGMLFSTEIIRTVASFLKKNAGGIPVVLDPVMIAKNGHALLQPEAIAALKRDLIPLAHVLTPNLFEAQCLLNDDKKILSKERLARGLLELGCASVLVKGGHGHPDDPENMCEDLWMNAQEKKHILSHERIVTKNTHGTGCTLSASIASLMAFDLSSLEACIQAKEYLFKAIKAGRDHVVGQGNGPVHHFHALWPFL